MIQLRPYQTELCNRVLGAWAAGYNNVLLVLPTGAGKTIIMAELLNSHGRAAAVIAHRSELVGQTSLALSQVQAKHRIIAPDNIIRFISMNNHRETGKTFIDPGAPIGAVSIDTLRARYRKETKDKLTVHTPGSIHQWRNQVSLWAQDEAHHVLKSNKWGEISEIFPNAKGLGVTATPLRADGNGLGRHHDGVFDIMIEGPSMRWLIDEGYLTEYRIACLPLVMDLTGLKTGKDGEFTRPTLKKASDKSPIVGNVVEHYLKFAKGKTGITFATDVETAGKIANQYNQAGVPAMMISAKTPDHIRNEAVRRLRNKELLQLVNVDLFGEGFDLPAVEVVSMARPTQSFGLYSQQFGRALRPHKGKTHGIIIDHVGNVVRHGLPDTPRKWTLDRRDRVVRGANKDVPPVTACVQCFSPYSGFLSACPYCGHKPEPEARTSAEFVEGDLFELDEATLAKMRGEINKANLSPAQIETWMKNQGHNEIVCRAAANRQNDKLATQANLREAMGVWGGARHASGMSDSEMQKEFYWRFGVDVMSAMALGTKDAIKLKERLENGRN